MLPSGEPQCRECTLATARRVPRRRCRLSGRSRGGSPTRCRSDRHFFPRGHLFLSGRPTSRASGESSCCRARSASARSRATLASPRTTSGTRDLARSVMRCAMRPRPRIRARVAASTIGDPDSNRIDESQSSDVFVRIDIALFTLLVDVTYAMTILIVSPLRPEDGMPIAVRGTDGPPHLPHRRGRRPSAAAAAAVLLMLTGGAARLAAQTVTLQAIADTTIKQGSPNQSFGAQKTLVLKEGGSRVLVRFDPAAIVAAVGGGSLASAQIQLYVGANAANWGPTGRTLDAYRLDAAWVE